MQRQLTWKLAGNMNFKVLRIISEPTAAAIACGLDTFADSKERNVVVIDFSAANCPGPGPMTSLLLGHKLQIA